MRILLRVSGRGIICTHVLDIFTVQYRYSTPQKYIILLTSANNTLTSLSSYSESISHSSTLYCIFFSHESIVFLPRLSSFLEVCHSPHKSIILFTSLSTIFLTHTVCHFPTDLQFYPIVYIVIFLQIPPTHVSIPNS